MPDQNIFRRVSVILFFLSLMMLAIHMESNVRFNRRDFQLHGCDASSPVRMEIDARKDSTSTWLKRSFRLDDTRIVDLTGQTIDGTLQNGGSDAIRDWELRINITGDCFINQAWNGEVEIHQFTGTEKEKVQRLNLQNYQLEDVIFENRYDGDLLIPLQSGDYVIYYPSGRFSEMPIASGEDVKIGMIFYYVNDLDLSDYDVQYHHHREFTQGMTFYPFIILAVLWLLTAILTTAVTLSYRRIRKENELRKSGISSMSDIYDVIYIIRLSDGEMTPVSVEEKIERSRPKNQTAKQSMTEMILRDVDEPFRDRILSFVDTDTLPERLKERNSIVTEFLSKSYGWCSLRFCAMDREEGKPLENVVFAVQNINEEKKDLEAMMAQIDQLQSASKSSSDLVAHLSNSFETPMQALLSRIEQILKENQDEAIRVYARDARSIATRLLSLTEGLVADTKLQSGEIRMAEEIYSLRELLTGTLRAVLPQAQEQRTAVALDAAETLPDHLRGDAGLLREVLMNLMFALLPEAGGGKMLLSIYGKVLEEKIHLLFSVRAFPAQAEADGNTPEADNASGLTELNLEVASGLLTGMGTVLRDVPSPADRREYYFEMEQRIAAQGSLGKLSADDILL